MLGILVLRPHPGNGSPSRGRAPDLTVETLPIACAKHLSGFYANALPIDIRHGPTEPSARMEFSDVNQLVYASADVEARRDACQTPAAWGWRPTTQRLASL